MQLDPVPYSLNVTQLHLTALKTVLYHFNCPWKKDIFVIKAFNAFKKFQHSNILTISVRKIHSLKKKKSSFCAFEALKLPSHSVL